MTQDIEADYIIVGAGSAGCVLADRLSANPKTRVLLLEAGGDDRPTRNFTQFKSNMLIHIPVGFAHTLNDPKISWMYKTEADEGTGGRVHSWPRGKVLGGSSSINAMLYVRGQREDYDGWRQLGCEGWSYDDVLPYFLKSQHQERGADEWNGVGGPLNVSDMREGHPVSDAAIDACVEAGLPRRSDINGADQEGVSWLQVTMKHGRRWSTAVAYLHPAMRRPNLSVVTGALTTRVLLKDGRAVGVEYLEGGELKTASARAEVLLCGGAVNSPQLLQLSGIGPGQVLSEHGVETLVERPGVGENLQDHYIVGTYYRLKAGIVSINELSKGLRLVGEVLKYAFRRRGVLTLSVANVNVFAKSRPSVASPDIQLLMMPATADAEKTARTGKSHLEDHPGLTIAPVQLRPESRGTIHICSPDPTKHPAITPNYLSNPLDHEVTVAGVRWARRIASQPSLQRVIEAEAMPGLTDDDDKLLAYARMAGSTMYHPVGTCQMGHGPNAVVDPQLRVHGVQGLRVVDASVMPRLVSGNTNAPTIMIAEKAADMIIEANR